MPSTKQITNSIFKQLNKWNINNSIDSANDEYNTRTSLIDPFFQLLGYKYSTDFVHEFTADMNGKRGKKVDMAFTFGKQNPLMIVECKRANISLNNNHFRQLNEYCIDLPSVRVGIITNGITYDFYTKNGNTLNPKPFFSFDLLDYDLSDIEELSMFERSVLNFDNIIEEAEESYFLDKFDEAFYNVLNNPSDNLIKEIYQGMGGKRTSPKINEKIKSLINHISIKNVADKLQEKASKDSISGIVTTDEEIKFFNIVKTILGLSNKFKNTELDRVFYRDYKNFFSILVDDNQRKTVAQLKYKSKKPIIVVGSDEIKLDEVSVLEITKHKSKIIDSAISQLN